MTTIDHQQAAIRAIAAALHGDACPASQPQAEPETWQPEQQPIEDQPPF